MENLLRTTTPIRYPSYEYSKGHATGFFYRTIHDTYLITARHCLFQSRQEPGGPFKPRSISICIRDKLEHTQTGSKQISLYSEGDPRWIEPHHYNVDIAAIPLDMSLRDTGNTSFGGGSRFKASYQPKNIASPGESAIVAGYPVLDRDSYSPVLRDALISTGLDVDYDEQPSFLIDSKLHEGTSGSPVLVQKPYKNGRPQFTVIGVHSGQYDLTDEGSENLNRVWFLQHLRTRLDDIEPGILEMW